MCLCGNLGLLKESGQYSTLAPKVQKVVRTFIFASLNA